MPDLQIINAKKIVVMGDGPAAMITCIKLSQLGVASITLVGPRINYYIRSGEFNREVFEKVNEVISPLTINIPHTYGSSANYIKNLEKQLYAYLIQLNICCIKKKFVTFMSNKQIQLANLQDANDIELIEADLVFDCTGAKRAVIKALNKQLPEAPFQIKPVSDSSYDFAMARFDYSLQDNSKMKKAKNSLIEEMLLLLKLRSLGWPYYVLPTFYHFDWESNNPKQNLYFEYHGTATSNQVQEMASLLESYHSLYFDAKKINANNFFHAHSKEHPDKKIIATFKFAPCLTTPGFYKGNQALPVVIPLGDSLLDVPFVFARSLITFSNVLKSCASSLTIKDGEISTFDLKSYEEQVKKQLESSIKKIKKGFLELAEMSELSSIHEAKQKIATRTVSI